MKIFIIRFADLWLKGLNRNEFINLLFINIKKAISDFKFYLEKKFDRFHLRITNIEEEYMVISILKFVPGISLIIPTFLIPNDIDKITKTTLLHLDIQARTFKVESKREKKDFPMSSYEIKTTVASAIIKKFNYIVDVHNPNVIVYIKIGIRNCYLSFDKIKGIGGLPIGINGSTLSLISGGIDSAVSSFIMQKKGLKVHYLIFLEKNDLSSILINKIKKIINILTFQNKIFVPKLFIVYFDSIQQELAHAKNNSYRIILMRRSFYRIASQIAILNSIDSITSGDSLGQVASQTIESIKVISNSIDTIIFRPLLGMEKNQIISISKEIKTYDLSIEDHNDICSNFNPKNPSTKPKLEILNSIESELNLLPSLELSAIKNMEIFEA